ncbi:MAG: hypothetical protein ACOX6V_00865 [Patescibacteria group bacterium]|jgi:hypothetical protein
MSQSDIFGEDIKIKKLFYTYLEQLKLKGMDELTSNTFQELFWVTTEDFIDMKLDLDEYSSLLEKMWTYSWDEPAIKDSKVADMCLLGAELSWYVRNDPKTAGDYLNEILEFYKTMPSVSK